MITVAAVIYLYPLVELTLLITTEFQQKSNKASKQQNQNMPHQCFPSKCVLCFFFSLRFNNFISLWVHWVFIAVYGAFSSCGEWGLLSSCVCRLLIAVASLLAEHRLSGVWALWLWLMGLAAPQHVGSS